jgi:hypothetical protein
MEGIDTVHYFGKSKIMQSKLDEEVSEILEVLKKEKQTYCINKFVLEEAIKELGNQII